MNTDNQADAVLLPSFSDFEPTEYQIKKPGSLKTKQVPISFFNNTPSPAASPGKTTLPNSPTKKAHPFNP